MKVDSEINTHKFVCCRLLFSEFQFNDEKLSTYLMTSHKNQSIFAHICKLSDIYNIR